MSHTAEEYRNRGDSIQTALDESYGDQLAIVIVLAKEAREVVAMLREAAEMREALERLSVLTSKTSVNRRVAAIRREIRSILGTKGGESQ